MNGAKTGKERTALQRGKEAEHDEQISDRRTNAKTQLRQPANEMKAEQKYQCARDRSRGRANVRPFALRLKLDDLLR